MLKEDDFTGFCDSLTTAFVLSPCALGVFYNFSLITDRLRANVALKHPCFRLCDALQCLF
jgi:hypothetical protein